MEEEITVDDIYQRINLFNGAVESKMTPIDELKLFALEIIQDCHRALEGVDQPATINYKVYNSARKRVKSILSRALNNPLK